MIKMSSEVTTTKPVQCTHSLKLEDTEKGIRIHVHVYSNDMQTAINQVFSMYQEAKERCNKDSIPLAPIEVKDR